LAHTQNDNKSLAAHTSEKAKLLQVISTRVQIPR